MPDFLPAETQRLTLRRFQEKDKSPLLAYRSHPDIARYQSWESFTEEQAAELIREMESRPLGLPNQGLQIAWEARESGELIGDCFLQVNEHEKREAEIGFTLASAYQGQGLATEALFTVLENAFRLLDLHRIIAVTDCRNVSAVALLERLHFRREGHFLQNIWFKGAWGDEYLYAVLREEWTKKTPRGQ